MIGALWTTIFYEPIMNSLLFFYGLLGNNLGLAIIVVTILLRVILFPFMRSQYESSKKMRELQPQLKKIQKKYSRNPKKAQEEQMKLYRKVGYNPLGCFFSMVIPFPFMIAIYQAIRAFSLNELPEGTYTFVENFVGVGKDFAINTMFFGIDLAKSYLPLARLDEFNYWSPEILAYLIVALLVGVSQYFSMKFTQGMMGADIANAPDKEKEKKKKKKKKDEAPDPTDMMGDMSKSMSFTFPAMTAFLALSLPAAVSLYWILQSWVPVGMNRIYDKLKESLKNGKEGEKGSSKKESKKRK